MSKGSVGILNVGTGDTKLVFDKNSPQDCIDMLRRGYALLVTYDFDETKYEYIVADFDPTIAAKENADDDFEPPATPNDPPQAP